MSAGTQRCEKRYMFLGSLLYSSFLFEDIRFGGLLEHATRKSTLRQQRNIPVVKWYGARCLQGTAGLYFLPPGTTMNGEKYVNLLKSKLELHMKVHNCKIFMHNGAPCHRSKVVVNFMEQKRIQMLECPGNSPDLNPIENLWNFMKKKVSEKHPSSLDALQTAIKEVWVREIAPCLCCKLIDGMSCRLQDVIKTTVATQNI